MTCEGDPVPVLAACFHDHLFVPSERADEAFEAQLEPERGTI
jgi:hypothetical protein